MSEVLLTSDLAKRLNRHVATIRRWAAEELIPMRRRGNKRYMVFDLEAVQAAMAKNGLKSGEGK